ncbi:MAG: hypothetical protein PHY30_01535 [Candidatus Pacebacteria bacterium]|nr:hypothetical protein [Candidatus Paceibacterota bacterium]
MKYTEKQKGSLYLTVVLLGIVLAIAIGVTGIIVTGSNLIKGLGDSVRAFHIADSGVEEELYRLRQESGVPKDDPPNPCSSSFTNYGITTCTIQSTSTSLKVIGSYNGSQRRIEADY